jgi:hypothetical protein
MVRHVINAPPLPCPPRPRARARLLGAGRWPPAHLCPARFVRFVPPAVPQRDRSPEALAVRIVDRVRLAEETDARAGVRRSPALVVLREFVPLRKLDRRALEEQSLLCRRELRDIFAWHLHFHLAHGLYLAWILPDAFDLELRLRHRTDGKCTLAIASLVRLERWRRKFPETSPSASILECQYSV